MPKKLTVSTKYADFDGLVTVTFTGEDESTIREVTVPFVEERIEIEKQLNNDETSGTAFCNAVRRYIMVRHGITVSSQAAVTYYQSLVDLVEESHKLFYPSPDVQDSTDKISETIPKN